jgi:hypothetical protein
MNYIEFKMCPDGLVTTVESHWECRNLGLTKIMSRVQEALVSEGLLDAEYIVRINTADGPSRDPAHEGSNFMEFDTSTDLMDESNVFPDYIFGNWWHIGLVDFDEFAAEISGLSEYGRIADKRIFWTGNLQGIPQRIEYMKLASRHPGVVFGHSMYWLDCGRKPNRFIPMKDYARFKYLIDLTGHGCSGRLKLLPFCRRPLFVAERTFLSWSDILLLKQGRHISVRRDLGNLLDLHRWAEMNQQKVFEDCNALFKWSRENFTFERACERALEMVRGRLLGSSRP